MDRSAVTFAKTLRRDCTDAESLLWRHLRGRRFASCKFKRQQPLGPYVVDFVCFAARVVVEVDGGQHLLSESDAARDAWLRQQGFKILRFWNNDVLLRTESVLEHLLEYLFLFFGSFFTRGEGSKSEQRL